MPDEPPAPVAVPDEEDVAGVGNEPQPLDPRHHEAMMAYLECGSIPKTADLVGRDRTCIWRWLRREDVRAEMTRIQEDATRLTRAYLAWKAPPMARITVGIAENPGETRDDAALSGVSLRASLGALDRAGVGASSKHEVDIHTEQRPPTEDEWREAEAEAARYLETKRGDDEPGD